MSIQEAIDRLVPVQAMADTATGQVHRSVIISFSDKDAEALRVVIGAAAELQACKVKVEGLVTI